MEEPYIPKVNDYVVWERENWTGIIRDEGWVYFICDEYITIETSVRPKPKETLDCKSSNHHKMIHSLLLCYASHWKDLKYVKSRTPHEQIEHYSQCDD